MKKIVIAIDSFKESLSAIEVADSLERGIKKVFPEIIVKKFPLADGGEGTVQALVDASNGKIYYAKVNDPLMREVEAFYGILGDNKTCVIEMAAASGLPLLKVAERNPEKTTTYGTGQLIKAALDKGCRNFIIGIGGSATNDGGAGMFQALGGKLLDRSGKEIKYGAKELLKLKSIDLNNFDSRLKDTKFMVACDVDNTLLGAKGASFIYGPQKGATDEMLVTLDNALSNFADVIEKELNRDIRNIVGGGAAGGLGAGLLAFFDAQLKSGIEIVINTIGFKDEIEDTDLIITGEGKIDGQTLEGKVPLGVAKVAKEKGIPVIAITGTYLQEGKSLYQQGINAIFSIINRPMSLEKALNEGKTMLEDLAEDIMRVINLKIG